MEKSPEEKAARLMQQRNFSRDVVDFARILNERKVDYVMIGGWAVGAHGYPRLTEDVDFLVSDTMESSAKCAVALKEFVGAEIPDAYFTRNRALLRFGQTPQIDVLNFHDLAIDSFDEIKAQQMVVHFGDVAFPIIGLEHLIEMKQKVGRPQDLVDVEALRKIKAHSK